MKVSPFIEPSRQARPTKRNKPLTRDFFSQLIKLETEFHNKTYTMTILDELIQFYAKAVEYYDKAKEEISGYFVFKIQDVLATKKSLKMLLDQNVKNFDKRDSNSSVNEYNENNETSSSSMGQKSAPHSKQYISENILEEISEEEDDEREEKVQIVSEKKRQEIRPMRKNRTSISTMKNQKQRFVNFFYKMETQKASEKQNMHLILDGFALTSDKNDTFVKRDIDNQKHILRRRLENRKAEVFMSQTINTQNSHFGIGNENIERKENEAILENFLEELDAEQFEEEGVEGKNEQILHDLLSNQTSLKEKSRRIKIQNNLQTNITDADIVFDSIRQNLEVDISGLFSPKRNPGYFSPSSAQYKPRSKFF